MTDLTHTLSIDLEVSMILKVDDSFFNIINKLSDLALRGAGLQAMSEVERLQKFINANLEKADDPSPLDSDA